MSKFNSESARNEFKGLCIEVLPAIRNIEQTLAKAGVTEGASIRAGDSGYLALDVHDSKWRMARYTADGPVKMIYEHSEEIKVPEIGKERAVFGRLTENIMEITLVYAEMLKENGKLGNIESIEWKQQFVEWANEFEESWGEADLRDYPEEIGKFARRKITGYAEEYTSGERK